MDLELYECQKFATTGMIISELDGKIKSIGNCAGSGAKMYLLSKEYRNLIVNKINTSKYIELSNRKEFQDYFVNGMMMERIYEPAQKISNRRSCCKLNLICVLDTNMVKIFSVI